MGRWSRAVAPVFLDWLGAARRASWLDVGCGTGILAETLVELCAPASVHGVDPAAAQVSAAARGPARNRAQFQVADARKLPFADASFDVVASALVINFIAERPRALAEMRRLGADVPGIPGTEASRLEALRALFLEAGLEQIETRTVDVCLAYADFTDFWESQTPDYQPTTKIIAQMKPSERTRLMHAVQAALPAGPNGSIEYCARANAIKARVPR